jgi:hypothetical protein
MTKSYALENFSKHVNHRNMAKYNMNYKNSHIFFDSINKKNIFGENND